MKPPRLLQTLLAVLPVLTAGLYLLGLSYNEGYLDAFGIDDSIFPIPSDKALFTGFYILVTLSFPSGLYAIGAIGTFIVLVVVVAVLTSVARVQSIVARIKTWLFFRFRKLTVAPTADALLDKGATAYAYVSGFVVSLSLLLVMAALSSKTGREQAEKAMADYARGKTVVAEFFLHQSPKPLVGKLVMCGERHCALWSPEGTTIVRHDLVERIVTHDSVHKRTVVEKPVASAP